MRCVLHASLYDENCFITLTYDEKLDGYHNNLDYSDIQKFKKRLRSHCWRNYKKRVQVFNVHEYGKNGKKHWHLILFNHNFPDRTLPAGSRYYVSEELGKLWTYGFHTIGDVTEASAMYQAQYTQKDFKNGNNNNSKKAHSKHSGIGRDYFVEHYEQLLSLGYVPYNGRKAPLPRYFEKIAHRQYSHYFEPENFIDTVKRKRLYSPLKPGAENRHMAELFSVYKQKKYELTQKLMLEWDEFIAENLFTDRPDFKQSEENYLHDLINKQRLKEF